MARLLRVFAPLLCVLGLSSSAFAKMMEHYDLTSLALEAEAVVRVRVVAEKKKDAYTTLTTLEVVRAYAGPLAPGASIELSYDGYSMHPLFDFRDVDAGGKVLGPELAIFLNRPVIQHYPRDPVVVDPHDGVERTWRIVPSGLRIFLDGKAQRFEQMNNPGGFDPVPQGHDPYDVYGDPRGEGELDLAGLEAEITTALGRAATIRSALERSDGPERREQLVRLAGLDEPATKTTFSFYENLAAERILGALADTHDLTLFLQALSRASGVSTRKLALAFPAADVLDAAGNTKLPAPLRRAALRLAEGMPFELRELPNAEARVIAMFADEDPDVRIEALALDPAQSPSSALRAAIAYRFTVETDERVRLALFAAASRVQMLAQLPRNPAREPILGAMLSRDVVRIGWADFNPNAAWRVGSSSRVVLQRSGKPSEEFPVSGGQSSSGLEGNVIMRIPPSLDRSPCDVTLRVVLESDKQPKVERTFLLGAYVPLTIAVASADAGAATAFETGHDGVDASLPAAPRGDLTPKRSGCHCSTPGPSELVWAWPLALLVLARKRRVYGPRLRRRCSYTHSHLS